MADILGTGMDKHIQALKKKKNQCSFLSSDPNAIGYNWVSSWSEKG